MVIQQFNRLIKNKWVWGVFALTISALFLIPDEWISGRRNGTFDPNSVGTLGGEDVKRSVFNEMLQDVRSGNRNRSEDNSYAKDNHRAWQNLATLETARQMGLEAGDEAVREAILQGFSGQDGAFNAERYDQWLQYEGLSRAQHQEKMRRLLSCRALAVALNDCADWVSPAEIDSAVNDETDRFTVRIVSFSDKNAEKVKVDDKAVRDYYDANTNSFALPENCMVVRYAKLLADAPGRLATFTVTDDEMQDYYDARSSDFKKTGTNGVETVKTFEEVKGEIERLLKIQASIEDYQTKFFASVCPQPVDAKSSASPAEGKRDGLDRFAAAEKLTISTSKPFSPTDEKVVKGVMVRASRVIRDSSDFAEKVAALNDDPYECYGVATGTNCIYLLECVPLTNAVALVGDTRVPTFEALKEIIRPDALEDARMKAFKAEVEKVRVRAVAELVKDKPFDAKLFGDANVSTSIVFSASDFGQQGMSDVMYVAQAVRKLEVGNLSDFVEAGSNHRRALLVYLENREPGKDAAARRGLRAQVGGFLRNMQGRFLWSAWQDWNLNRIGYVPKDDAVDVAESKGSSDSNADEVDD